MEITKYKIILKKDDKIDTYYYDSKKDMLIAVDRFNNESNRFNIMEVYEDNNLITEYRTK